MRDFFSPVLILDLWSQMTISGAMIAEGRVIAAGEFRRGRNQTYLLAFVATSSTKSIEGGLTLCCRIPAETCYQYDGPGQPRGGQPVFPATPACRSRAPPGHDHCVGLARCECATAVDQIRALLQASASTRVFQIFTLLPQTPSYITPRRTWRKILFSSVPMPTGYIGAAASTSGRAKPLRGTAVSAMVGSGTLTVGKADSGRCDSDKSGYCWQSRKTV